MPRRPEKPRPKGLYRTLYGSAIEPKLFNGERYQFHGSLVRDLFIEYAKGRFLVDDHPEKLIRELVIDGLIVVYQREPTVSQRAFAGLSYNPKSFRELPWTAAGTAEQYWYGVK